jgi:hypothetical protein
MRRAVVSLWVLVLFAFFSACSEPPQKEIDRAQGAIDAARAAGAEQYASEPFAAATTAMQQTHEAVQQRDYRLALSRATDANERALEAARQAANGKARARGEADAAIGHLTAAVRQLDERLKVASARLSARDLEPARRVRDDADRALQEARAAVGTEEYLAALAIAKGVPDKITAEIRMLTDAMDARAPRGQRLRR